MPTPDRTSLDAIVLAARELLEESGLVGVTMQAVAGRVGVRAPSLYKRVQNRDELIRLVAEATLGDLTRELEGAAGVEEVLDRFRAYGLRRPAAFQLLMTPGPGVPTVSDEANAESAEVILAASAALAGEAHALEAARTLTAWATGFVSMEINGSFRLGGDVDDAWEFGVGRLVAALTAPPAG
ncbi:TetR/AcrR family transcriptional regulator [Microbacterium marinilacus]|nr:TetR/AcrR family transcriptional regulator [Microbacterium marinilacus]MBY0687373.1 TetR/AcrR family transcriptional regulator [Microbacterium marinilacus]